MKLLRIFILCLICLPVVQPVYPQVPIVTSTTKVTIDGKNFYQHNVKQGETLYSICRAYNVSQNDVESHNPDVSTGIRVGQEIKIPIAAESTPVTPQFQPTQFIYHITEKGQTAFRLTQLYNISLEELYRFNPEVENASLQAGQVVKIPKSADVVTQQAKPKPGYFLHTVKRKETLYSISKSYQVELNDVLEINPDIDSRKPKLKTGQQIKIPLKVEPTQPTQPDTVVHPDGQVGDVSDMFPSSATNNGSGCDETSQKEFNIALFLPLFLADNSPASPPDTSMVKDENGRFRYKDGRYWIHPRSANALEFYQGALLAIDSLKKQGLIPKVSIFDTMRDTVKMAQLLRSPAMRNMDLMIGPFSTEMVNQVRSFARENRIVYISPTAINAASIKANPYLMQVNAGEIHAVGPMVDFISKQQHIHVTLIGNKRESDQTLFNAYLNKLRSVFADSSLTIRQMRSDSLQQPTRYLKKNRTNIVIIPASDEVFVNVVTGQLNVATHGYTINLFGLASWTKFMNLDMEYLYAMEFRYATAFYIDYKKQDVQKFLQKYRKTYFTEPTMLTGLGEISSNAYQHAFLGYDVTFYFMSALKKYGKGFGQCIQDFRLPMLQSDFHFEKTDPYSGYINTHIDIYKYSKDYTVVKEE